MFPCEGCEVLVAHLPQEKYFRLENITSPKILVRGVLDYDAVQKISLVLHVRVRPSLSNHNVQEAAALRPLTYQTPPGHLQRLGLRPALLHVGGHHHRAGQGRGQPAAVVPAVSEDQPGDGQAVRERRLQRQSQPDREGGE